MKTLWKILVLLAALSFMTACGKEQPVSTEPRLSDVTLKDFNARNPGATITDVSFRSDIVTHILFTDRDGIPGESIYVEGVWVMTQKELDKTGDFFNQLPFQVAMTYLSETVPNAQYDDGNCYVVENARNGIDNKQYEFVFMATYTDGEREYPNLVYSIIISEDGTLLNRSHDFFNRSIWWYDIRTSADCIRERYPNAKLLGSVNDGGNNLFFLLDEGEMKIAKTRHTWTWTWAETRYRLPDDYPLPESALDACRSYMEAHDGISYSALYLVENNSGFYYGIQFGDEFENKTFFVKADVS